MRKSKVCYCEIGFLKEFFDSRPLFIEPTEEKVQLLWVWTSMYRFLSKAALILDISKAAFEHFLEEDDDKNVDYSNCSFNEDGNFKSWLKLINKSEGPIGFTEENDTFPNITELEISEEGISESDDQKLNAVYLTTLDDDACKKQSRLKGVIVLNNNLARESAHLFKDNGHAIPSEGARDWGFLKQMTFPSLNICNSIIIVDNYLFLDDKDTNGKTTFAWPDKLRRNLLPILKAFLPDCLDTNIVFEIAVFTTQDKDNHNMIFESQYKTIDTFLSNRKITYRICFYGKCHEAFHDRCILTNNVWISSGHGFGIFGKPNESSKPTTINIAFPFLQSSLLWCDGSFQNVLSQAKKVIGRLQEPNINYWGDENKHNRIVSHFTQNDSKEKTPYKKAIEKRIAEINYYPKIDRDGRIIR